MSLKDNLGPVSNDESNDALKELAPLLNDALKEFVAPEFKEILDAFSKGDYKKFCKLNMPLAEDGDQFA